MSNFPNERWLASLTHGKRKWYAECRYDTGTAVVITGGRPVRFSAKTRTEVIAKARKWADRQRAYRDLPPSEEVVV